MPDYVRLAATAARLIASAGAPVTLRRKVEGEYDTATGDVLEDRVTNYSGHGVKLDYTAREIDGTRIRAGDAHVYLSITGMVAPLTGDILSVNGIPWTVVRAETLQPGAITLLYDVQVRRG